MGILPQSISDAVVFVLAGIITPAHRFGIAME